MPVEVRTAGTISAGGWASTGNLSAADGAAATYTVVGGGVADSGSMILTNFGFAIPLGATDVSVQVAVLRKNADHPTTGVIDSEVYERLGGGRIGSNLWINEYWTATFTSQTYNLSTIAPADINNSSFGFELAVTLSADMEDIIASVDYIAMIVTYSGGGTFPPPDGIGGPGGGAAFFMLLCSLCLLLALSVEFNLPGLGVVSHVDRPAALLAAVSVAVLPPENAPLAVRAFQPVAGVVERAALGVGPERGVIDRLARLLAAGPQPAQQSEARDEHDPQRRGPLPVPHAQHVRLPHSGNRRDRRSAAFLGGRGGGLPVFPRATLGGHRLREFRFADALADQPPNERGHLDAVLFAVRLKRRVDLVTDAGLELFAGGHVAGHGSSNRPTPPRPLRPLLWPQLNGLSTTVATVLNEPPIARITEFRND